MPRLWDTYAVDADALTEIGATEVPKPASLTESFVSSMDAVRAEAAPTKARLLRFAGPYVQERSKMLEAATGIPADDWRGDLVTGPWWGEDDMTGSPAQRRARLLFHIRSGEIQVADDGSISAEGLEAASALEGNEDYARRLTAFEAALRNDPTIPSDEQIMRLIGEDVAAIQRRAAGLAEATPGAAAAVAEFAGGLAGGLANVLQSPGGPAMLAVGGLINVGGKIAAARIAQRAGIEAAFGGVTELPVQVEAMGLNQRIGVPYTMKEAAANVLFATLGSAVLGGGIQGGSELLGGLRGRLADAKSIDDGIAWDLSDLYAKAKAENPRIATMEADRAAAILADTAETARAAPRLLDEAQQRAHQAVAAKAREDLEAGDLPQIERQAEQLRASLPDEAIYNDADLPFKRRLTPDDLEAFDPQAIDVDAQLFQFKAGGDEFGVTERLRDVQQFEPAQAGTVLTWERADGKLFIVDGHQRMGIARRALAGGQAPDSVFLTGYRLREADGVTPQHARVLAAFKNIGEGTGSAVDVAKIYREAHRDLIAAMPQLSGNNALARDGRNLAKLDDEAFGMVVNDVVKPEYGAIVGEVLKDGAEQVAAIDVLRRAAPANQGEARAIVEQVRAAGFTRTAQRSQGALFSDAEFAESLFRERAQILQSAKAEIRRDLATFRTLGKQKGRISQAGNKLADKQNLAKVEEDEQVLTEIDRLANVAGPVADALNAAARKLGAGTVNRTEAVAAFVGDLRAAATRTGGDGKQAGSRQRGAAANEGLTERGNVWVDDAGVERAAPGALTAAERAVEDRIAVVVSNVDAAGRKYADLKDAEGGLVLNTDTARELSTDYLKDRSLAPAVHEPASWLIRQLYERKLAGETPAGREPVVLFSAGGTGAGKSTIVKGLDDSIAKQEIIYDTNTSSLDSAVRKIDQALAAGRQVEILYTYRDPVDALVNGALKRAMRQAGDFGSGRTIRLSVHMETHVGARQTIPRLIDKYDGDERVRFVFVDNSNGPGAWREAGDINELPDVLESGLYERLNQALEAEFAAGRISEAVYRGFKEEAGAAVGVEGPRQAQSDGRPAPPDRVDLLGDDVSAANAIAAETAKRDAVRSGGQVSLETGDPSDLFSAARKQANLFDEAAAARALERAQEVIGEAPERMITLTDEAGVERRVPASRAFDDLDAEEAALRRVALCTTPGEA